MLAAFLISVFLVLYIFIGYPLVLWLIGRFHSAPVRKGPYEPTVSLVISAYNEAEIIREKLKNTFALSYPAEKLEVIVADDGSTDGTDKIVEAYENVRLLRIERRKGKVECQNQAAAAATGEIIVFSDANSMYEKDALTALMQNLSDESVGVVCGELRYVRNDKSDEGLYWKLEQFLKRTESNIGSCLGANGAIYAIRKNLYRNLPPDACSDFVEPFAVYEQGFRVVYEADAACTEEPEDTAHEFARKRRIVLNSFQSLRLIRPFLNPFRYGWYSAALWSHKVLRWYAFLFLALAFVSNAFLLYSPILKVVFIVQAGLYIGAVLGYLSRGRFFSVPYYFVAVNVASLLAFFDFILRKKVTAWEKVR